MKAVILSSARHTLTAIGAVLVYKGFGSDELMTEVVGSVITTAGLIWSFVEKRKK